MCQAMLAMPHGTRTSVMTLLRYSVPSCALNSVVSGKLIKIICCHKWLYGYEPCLLMILNLFLRILYDFGTVPTVLFLFFHFITVLQCWNAPTVLL